MKNIVLVITIILLSILLVGTAYIFKNEELCCKYDICKQFSDICIPEQEETVLNRILSVKGVPITLNNLDSGDIVEVGTEIEGSIVGSWFFEGDFPIRVLDRQGDEIGVVLARAKGDWMTEEEVDFSFVLDIDIDDESIVVLKLEKSNPSDLEENSDYAQISVSVKPKDDGVEMIKVKVFFPNSKIDSEMLDCSLVFPVQREIEKTLAVGRASLEELFKGPSDNELEGGYFTNIPEGVQIQSLDIKDGVATVDLSSELEEGVGGSCMVTSIRAQIEETLKQFSTVDSVIISIDGRTEDILQP
jgi:hypothetical protein